MIFPFHPAITTAGNQDRRNWFTEVGQGMVGLLKAVTDTRRP
jgi:hypothetical protein